MTHARIRGLLTLAASRQGLSAACAGLAGAGAGLLGVLDGWWPVVALAAYGTVWLLPARWWRARPLALGAVDGHADLAHTLAHLREQALDALPEALATQLGQLLDQIAVLEPRLRARAEESPEAFQAGDDLSRMVRMHLATSVAAFLRLPERARESLDAGSGKLPEALLREQLRWMHAYVVQLEHACDKGDMAALLLHHRLLHERYGANLRLPVGRE